MIGLKLFLTCSWSSAEEKNIQRVEKNVAVKFSLHVRVLVGTPLCSPRWSFTVVLVYDRNGYLRRHCSQEKKGENLSDVLH